jgi:hypothetical protein
MRLGAMTWDEIHTRSSQEISKRLDFTRCKLGLGFTGKNLSLPSPLNEQFFFSSADVPALISAMRQRFPQECEQTVRQAEQICRHEFDLLGYKGVRFGSKIDWRSDPVHGKRAPQRPWFKIHYLNFDEVGDSKIIWELNRHQHLVTLAKAYRLTNETRFSNELFSQWFDWQSQNPYPLGINWASNLEVAFRALAWLWVWYLVVNTPTLPTNFPSQFSESLAICGRHLEKYLSTYFSPNTHLLGEGVALFFIGVLCPHLPGALRWKTKGWEIVRNELRRQVRSDGMHFEQSTYYHVYALDFFLHARILASRNNIIIPHELDDTIVKMLEFLAILSRTGPLPRFGDDDGGRLFDPQRNSTANLLDPLSTGAALFKRPHFKAAVHGACEETLWLLGIQGLADFDCLPSEPQPFRSVAFSESGIYVMTDTGPPISQMVIDAGPQGSLSAGHGHADALNVCFSAQGRELLADPGTYCYVSADNSRNEFRGTAAHNTLQVDGADQSVPEKPFSWRSLVNTKTDLWVASERFDLFRGSYTGYASRRQSVIHHRHIFHLRSDFWLVRDVAAGEGKHALDLFWHFAPDIMLEQKGSGIFLLEDPEGMRFALLCNDNSGWSTSLDKRWWSPAYGERQTAPVLRFHRTSPLPAELYSLLLPAPQSLANLAGLRLVAGGSSDASVRSCIFDRSSVAHHIVFSDHAKSWHVGCIESDARFVCCTVDILPGKQVLREFFLSEGSFLKWAGELRFAAAKPVLSYEGHGGIGADSLLSESVSTSPVLESDAATLQGPWPKGGG